MDWLIKAKKVSECPDCGGSGYVPEDCDVTDHTDHLTIELLCSNCKGMGKVTEKVDLSLESLRDLLK